MPPRVLLAGIFHETHTFLEGTTSLRDFTIRRGAEMLAARGDGSPLAGALQAADESGWEVVPVIDLRATPSSTVEDDVVELFWAEFRQAVERETPRRIDAIYLVLHGAMVSRSILDVEGELLKRIRTLPGAKNVPVCGVMDLHGNITRENIELADGLVAYRCNPHTDACEAAVDAGRLLQKILATGQKPKGVWIPVDVVWAPTGTGTADDPMKTLEAMARDIERKNPEIAAVNVFGGFSFSDLRETGVSFSAYTFGDTAAARKELQRLADYAWKNRAAGNRRDASLEEVLPQVRGHLERGETPIVLVEPSDNIGGGAPGDGTSILRFLLAQKIENSAVVIDDAAAVAALAATPIGGTARLKIGGRGSRLAEGPLELDVELVSRSNGRFELEDRHSHLASMCGVQIDMGPCAVVRHQGVSILLTSRKTPPFDLGQLRSQGIIPEQQSVIGVKAAVAHRQAYRPIQKATYTVSTPGPCSSDLKTFPYVHLRRPVYPLDGE